MIQNARKRISVTSPYYVPDETIQMALVTAGSRGLGRGVVCLRDR
jgi:cardiolipin synthase